MSRLDLLIIHPGAADGIYGPDLAESLVAVEPPLWARLIAGYVRDRGFTVKVLDAEALGLNPWQVASEVKRLWPGLVCLAVMGHQPSASTQQMDGAGRTARYIRSFAPGVPIIMVGGHVAALPERTLTEESIDYACSGEGPETIVGLLRHDPIETIPGLVWHSWNPSRDFRGNVHVNPSAPLIDLDRLHGRAWDLLPMDKYRSHNWQTFGDLARRQPYASIYTSLGCPWKCSFCCINAPFGSNQYRMRDPASVVLEILDLYVNYRVKTFKIVDEMFVLNERHYSEICRLLVQTGITDDINLWAYARVDTVKPATLALLRKAGIRWLALGIESGSKYVRDGANKRLKNEDIKSVVQAIQAAGINVIGNFIFGLPDDDLASMQATLDLALGLNCEFANFYSAQAYPGSQLYTEALAKGWALPAAWSGYSQHSEDCRPLDTMHVSGATVLRFRDAAFQTYFTASSYLDMVERKFGLETLEHVKAMTKFKLKRKLLEQVAA